MRPYLVRRVTNLVRHADGATFGSVEQRLQAHMATHCSDRRSVLCSRLKGWDLCNAQVRHSTIHEAGSGLFATRELAAGELITFYPGNTVLEHGPALFHDVAMSRDHEVLFECDGIVRVIGNPEAIDDAAYLGHMSNDCSSCHHPSSIREYALSAATHANTDHVSVEGCHIATVASRRISSGEELFVSYGPNFLAHSARLLAGGSRLGRG